MNRERDYWYFIDRYTEWGTWERMAYVKTYPEALAIARYCKTLYGTSIKLWHGDTDISQELATGAIDDEYGQKVVGLEGFRRRKKRW